MRNVLTSFPTLLAFLAWFTHSRIGWDLCIFTLIYAPGMCASLLLGVSERRVLSHATAAGGPDTSIHDNGISRIEGVELNTVGNFHDEIYDGIGSDDEGCGSGGNQLDPIGSHGGLVWRLQRGSTVLTSVSLTNCHLDVFLFPLYLLPSSSSSTSFSPHHCCVTTPCDVLGRPCNIRTPPQLSAHLQGGQRGVPRTFFPKPCRTERKLHGPSARHLGNGRHGAGKRTMWPG